MKKLPGSSLLMKWGISEDSEIMDPFSGWKWQRQNYRFDMIYSRVLVAGKMSLC